MGTMVDVGETDIDKFIRGHKSKLQHERNYLDGQSGPSPRSRKQWEREQARDIRPAVQPSKGPKEPEETGLAFNNDAQDKKKQQLQAERQQEYNDLIAKRGYGRRRPFTPGQEEGLPLGQYENVRKALVEERRKETQQAMQAKPRQASQRHIVSPEQGLHIGPDQSERDRQIHAQKIQLRKDLDQQIQRPPRHITPPEYGIQIGPDQEERDRIAKLRKKQLKHDLEQQRQRPPRHITPPEYGIQIGPDQEERDRIAKLRKKQLKHDLEQQRQKGQRLITPPEPGMQIGPDQAERDRIAKLRKKQLKHDLDQQMLKDVGHITPPEYGMQIGPDQSVRDRKMHERKLQLKQDLEKQREEKLFHKVTEPSYDVYLTPRQYEKQKFVENVKSPTHTIPYPRPSQEPTRPHGDIQGQAYQQRIKQPSKRLPINKEDDSNTECPLDSVELQGYQKARQEFSQEKYWEGRRRSYIRDMDIDGISPGERMSRRDKYTWYNDKQSSPPLGVRRSRSVSPKSFRDMEQKFDYKETQKAHLEEKKREYNKYLQEQRQRGGRYVEPPEPGLFIGPDQSVRNRQIKERNLQFKKEIEKQQEEKLFHKFQEATYDPFLSPRRYEQQKLKEGVKGQRAPRNRGIPDQSPRKLAFREEAAQQHSRRPPLFKEHDPQDDLHLPLHRVGDEGHLEDRQREEGGLDRYGPPPGQGRSYIRDMDIGGDRGSRKEKYMWYNDKKSSPPMDMRRSRSVSPPSHRDKVDLEELRRSLEDMDQQQRHLKAEYERGQPPDNRQEAPGPSDRNRQKLEEDRRREYQEYLEKHPKLSLRGKEVTPENLRLGLPLDQHKYDDRKRALETERHREYNEMLQKLPPPRKESEEVSENVGIDLRGYDEEQKKQLLEEKRREYNELLAELPKKNRDTGRLEGTAATLPVGEYDDQRKQQLLEERHNEYLQLQQQKLATERHRGLPPKPPTPNHYFKTLGEHDRTAHMLNEERKKEYNQKMEKDRLRTGATRRGGPDSGGAVLIDKSDSPALRKKKELNDEYNRYLEEKRVKDAHRLDHKKPPTAAAPRHGMPPSPKASPRVEKNKDVFATLPGLKYSDSADKRKIQERNKEYNDYLKLKEGPRKGWATPTYEEILDQKRREERLRRQEEDYENEQPRLRPYASEGAINKLEDEFRGRQLDKEYEARKVRFDDERRLQQNRGGILEDDNWLRPERREEEYNHLSEQPRVEAREDMATRVTRPAQYQASLQVGGTENLGNDESGSAKRRRQADYRRELQLQMDEFKAAKKREKVQELRVNATGLLDPEKSSERMKGLTGGQGLTPRKEYKAREVQPYHTKFFLGSGKAAQNERIRAGRPRDEDSDILPPKQAETVIKSKGPAPMPGFRGAQALNIGNLGALNLGALGRPGLHDASSAGSLIQKDNVQWPGSIGGSDRGNLSRNEPQLSNRNDPIIHDDFSDVEEQRESSRAPAKKETKPTRRSGDSFGGGYDPGYGAPEPRGRRRERGGLFDTGLEGLLEARRQPGIVDVPPGLRYNASTYVTAGGLGTNGLGAGGQVDDAYHYYGMKNLLDTNDPGMNLGLNLGGGGGGGGGGYRGSPTPRVTFADDSPNISYRKRDKSGERISPYQFRSDDDTRSRSRTDTASYGAELERQIQEKRRQKQREREEQDRYERKLEEDIKNYNPFGRGGGGAPIRDEGGNAIADLRAVQKGYSPRRVSPTFSPRPPSPRDDKIKPPPPQQTLQGENTYARGGHGIFGQPKTDAEKDVTDKYKDELRLQIEEKRRLQQLEKDREKQEEALENKRLEDQRRRMQEEYEEEQRKIKAREEETRRKNEELKQAAEERKRDAERQKREAEDRRMRDQQDHLDRERQEKENERRRAEADRKSPPIPTLKNKMMPIPQQHYSYSYVQADDQRGKSPPLPAHRAEDRGSPAANRPPRSRASVRSQQVTPHPVPVSDRPSSSDVLTQLASMRKQLQSERKRVENALENSKNEPEVFDPRLVQKAPQNKLIFENAMNKNASLPPPRAQTSDLANARNIQQFNELKYKTDTDSRRQFRSMYQDAPVTNMNLEQQQQAMLRQQAEQIKALTERIVSETETLNALQTASLRSIPDPIFKDTYDPTPSTSLYHRPGNVSARSQLEANSAFIDVDGVNHFPEDFEDMPGARNDSARARRRDRFSPRGPSNMYMGSQASLDVDSIQRKNEERLRRLRQGTAGDDISVTDPDDILDRFMSQQRYNRPPSGQTLQDDSWLRPGSKVI